MFTLHQITEFDQTDRYGPPWPGLIQHCKIGSVEWSQCWKQTEPNGAGYGPSCAWNACGYRRAALMRAQLQEDQSLEYFVGAERYGK